MSEPTDVDTRPYTARSLIATGAQAQVWLAAGPDGDVALKVARSANGRAGLQREAAVLREHPHVGLVKLFDAAEDGSWIAVERIQGALLDDWSEGRTVDEVVAIVFPLLDTLEHLHLCGVIHGDLKPTNIIVDDEGRPRLLDLGVSTRVGEDRKGFRGTLGYAAPEVLRGRPSTEATDVYGLGATLYACLTGRQPFVASDPAALTYLPLVSLPPPPSSIRPEIPTSLNQVLLALLARAPTRRPARIERVRDTLRQSVDAAQAAGLARGAGPAESSPVLGMDDERETLRQAVVGAADGETRVVVLYGPPGCGRRTLVAEAVEYARREGLPYVKATDLKLALQQMKASSRPTVTVLRAHHKGARRMAELVLEERVPCMVILHADRPIPSLAAIGAIEVTPAPLGLRETTTLVRLHGGATQDAEAIWRASLGLPVAVLGQIRRHKRLVSPSPINYDAIPTESRRILAALTGRGAVSVVELAGEIGFSEHLLLDHCEALFAEGLVNAADDGNAIERSSS